MFGESKLFFYKDIRDICGQCFIYIILLTAVSLLPHRPIHILGWLNYSLYFLLAALSFKVLKNDPFLKDIFKNFALMFLTFSLSFPILFTGEDYLWGNSHAMYSAFIYGTAIWLTLLNFTISYLVLKYLFPGFKLLLYFLSAGFSLLLVVSSFYPFLINTNTVYQLNYDVFFSRQIPLISIPLVLLGLYVIMFIRKDRPNGAFISMFVFSLFIYLLLELVDVLSMVSGNFVYAASQYFLLLCLIIMGSSLFLRLRILYDDEFKIKESLIFDRSKSFFLPVYNHDEMRYKYFSIIKIILARHSAWINIVFGVIFLTIVVVWQSLFVTVKLLSLAIWTISMYFAFDYIYQRRFNKGQLLNSTIK